MKCENIRELMSAYIDNEINEVDKAKIEKHIAQCPQCKEEYELLKTLVLECIEIDEVDLPQDFREELHNKLMNAKADKRIKLVKFIKRANWKPAVAAVAAVLILAISLNSLGGRRLYSPMQTAPAPAADSSENTAFYDRVVTEDAKAKGMGAANTPEVAPTPAPAAEAPNVSFSKSMPSSEDAVRIQTTSADLAPQQERKIIKNGNVSLKALDVQTRIKDITALAETNGGYVESSYVDNIVQPTVEIVENRKVVKETTTMVANMTIRLPADKFQGAFETIIGMGTLVNQNSNSSDITSQYKDIEARVANLKVQEKNLQEIMTKATNVEDTLRVEVELNRVRTDIDLMTGNLKNWDRLVEYSTIYINMTEIKEAKLEKVDVPGVWQNARQGFINTINSIRRGLEALFIFVVSALPYILILGAASLLALFWIRKKKKQ